MRFSYPGYSEILTGAAHDEVIDSNDNKRYPFLTVLEFLAWPVRRASRSGRGLRLLGNVPLDRTSTRTAPLP